MPSLNTIEERIISDLNLGYTLTTADASTTSAIVLSSYFRNPNWGSNQFLNWLIHRPNAVAAGDTFRYAGALTNTTGSIAQTGATWTNAPTGEAWNLLEPGVRPDQDIEPAINRALEYCSFHTVEPLSLAADAAMREVSATASWGTAVNSTPTKTTVAADVFPGMGIRSLVVTNSSANGYQPTVNIPVSPLEQVFVGTISRVKTGTTTATQILFDATNSAAFTGVTNPVHAESTWQYMQTIATVPAGCFQMNVRLQGTGGNNTVVVWQALWVMRASILRYNLPSYLDERFKVDSISMMPFTMATSNSTTTGVVMQALSVNPADVNKDEYSVDFPMPEANPTYVQFHPGGWQAMWTRRFGPRFGPGAGVGAGYFPLTLQMRIPYSERGTLVNQADVTACPLHLIVAAAEVQLLQSSQQAQKNSSKTLAEVKQEFFNAAAVRSTQGPARTKLVWQMPRALN